MPEKYHIHTVPTPGHFRRIGKYGSVDWREDCSRCTNCVKLRCIYEVYKHEAASNRDPQSALQTHYECKACFSCVQNCTKGLLGIALNPEYLDMGDEYWRPDIIATTWNQADTGRIPVSGAGYRGRFHGPGFDSIWTDMSEIVRPTRDGIHGREYISTMVDIGPKPMRLSFSPQGELTCPEASLIEIQLPAILDVPPWSMESERVLAQARAQAAHELKTLAVVAAKDLAAIPADRLSCVVPVVSAAEIDASKQAISQAPMVELVASGDVAAMASNVRQINPRAVLALRLDLTPESANRVSELAQGPIKVFHLVANLHGREKMPDGSAGRYIKDAMREVHGRLVKDGLRDSVTLIVTGGIALAEHMAKAIICGADLVGTDVSLLVSMGCHVCRDAHQNGSSHCPAGSHTLEAHYATQRMVNLMGAWHSQLIEVLGAMGIREVRRLRGEVGRAIFMEDIEKEAFGDLIRK